MGAHPQIGGGHVFGSVVTCFIVYKFLFGLSAQADVLVGYDFEDESTEGLEASTVASIEGLHVTAYSLSARVGLIGVVDTTLRPRMAGMRKVIC